MSNPTQSSLLRSMHSVSCCRATKCCCRSANPCCRQHTDCCAEEKGEHRSPKTTKKRRGTNLDVSPFRYHVLCQSQLLIPQCQLQDSRVQPKRDVHHAHHVHHVQIRILGRNYEHRASENPGIRQPPDPPPPTPSHLPSACWVGLGQGLPPRLRNKQEGRGGVCDVIDTVLPCPQPLSIVFGWLPHLVLSPPGSLGWLAVFIGWRHNNRWQSMCNYMARHLQHSSVFCSLYVCSCGGCTHHQLTPVGLESTDHLHIPCNINHDLSGRIVYTLQALLIGLAADRFRAHSVHGGGGDGSPSLVQRPRSPPVYGHSMTPDRHSADMAGRGTFLALPSRIGLKRSECAARLHRAALCPLPSSRTKL